jgi:alpha-glucosidase (family GH31 glycosyl hydrolase)
MNSFPWDYGLRAYEIISDYIKLRYRLMPYIYSSAYTAIQTGIPIMRSLFLEYPDDKEAYKADYQYFFGENIMVAPICDYSHSPIYEAKREVYLPQGQWIDYWTDEVFEGSRYINYVAPFEVLPMFVRNGSIIAYGIEIQSLSEYQSDKLEIHIYLSGGKTVTTIYDDDGITMGYKNGESEETRIEAEMSENVINVKVFPTKGAYRGHFQELDMHFVLHMVKPVNQVKVDGKVLEGVKDGEEVTSWRNDADKRLLHVITKVNKALGIFIEAK